MDKTSLAYELKLTKASANVTSLDTVDGRNFAKGLLIFCIIIGHNKIAQDYFPLLPFPILYFWHVQTFFVIPSPNREKTNPRKLIDYLVRYLTPYFAFTLAIYFVELATGSSSLSFPNSLLALIAGSAAALQPAIRLVVFWFLPTLASFTLARAIIANVPKPSRWFAYVISVLLGTAIAIAGPLQVYSILPLNIGIIPYLIFAALISDNLFLLYRKMDAWRGTLAIFSLLLLSLSAIFLTKTHDVINISYYRLGKTPLAIAIGLFAPALTLLVLAELARVARSIVFLQSLGKYSMQVFLLHQFFQIPLCLLTIKILKPNHSLPASLISLAISVSVTVSCAYFSGKALYALPPVKRFIFPANWRELVSRS
jgi:fucose 4-O-acetylase-like acetyltransferase